MRFIIGRKTSVSFEVINGHEVAKHYIGDEVEVVMQDKMETKAHHLRIGQVYDAQIIEEVWFKDREVNETLEIIKL